MTEFVSNLENTLMGGLYINTKVLLRPSKASVSIGVTDSNAMGFIFNKGFPHAIFFNVIP